MYGYIPLLCSLSAMNLNYRHHRECICCWVICLNSLVLPFSFCGEVLELNELLWCWICAYLLCSCSLKWKVKYFLGLENQHTFWSQTDLCSNFTPSVWLWGNHLTLLSLWFWLWTVDNSGFYLLGLLQGLNGIQQGGCLVTAWYAVNSL